MANEIVCPFFDGANWKQSRGVCRIVRNWCVRGNTNTGCLPQDQEDFSDFHGKIEGVTGEYGSLYGYPDELSKENKKRLMNCCCPIISKDAGENRELRNKLHQK